MDKLYKRELYLNKIRGFYSDAETIKVITGIRRCGKSSLLETIVEELKENGIEEKNIIEINLDKRPYKNVKTPEQLDKLIASLITDDNFKYIFIVTNQRGVGKEIMSEEDLKHIHERMISEVKNYGGRIDRIYYCTALTDSDIDRKPGIGMFLQILRDYPDIDKVKCLMIGDSDSDIKFAKNCGIVGIKVI